MFFYEFCIISKNTLFTELFWSTTSEKSRREANYLLFFTSGKKSTKFFEIDAPEKSRKFHTKAPVSESLLIKLTQVFSCDICKNFKNTCFYRTPAVAASVKYFINF